MFWLNPGSYFFLLISFYCHGAYHNSSLLSKFSAVSCLLHSSRKVEILCMKENPPCVMSNNKYKHDLVALCVCLNLKPSCSSTGSSGLNIKPWRKWCTLVKCLSLLQNGEFAYMYNDTVKVERCPYKGSSVPEQGSTITAVRRPRCGQFTELNG